MRLIKSKCNSVHFSPIEMYRAKRTQKVDEKVITGYHGNYHGQGWLDCTFKRKKLKVEINKKTYKFEVIGMVTFNKKGEAFKLNASIEIDYDDGKSFRRNIPGKIEICCKDHIIEMDKSSFGCFGSCCGLCKSKTVKYLETTGKLDLKKIDCKVFEVKAVNGPQPYPTINAEITFPCGTIYYLRISWKKDYKFTIDFEEQDLQQMYAKSLK